MKKRVFKQNADDLSKSHRQRRIAHWDTIACDTDTWQGWGGYYHKRLMEIYQFLVPPGQRVIEIGCGRGDLLAALRPAVGVGVDFSREMISRAARRHPELHFIQADASDPEMKETFDVIILSDLLNDVWDVLAIFNRIACLSTPRTRVIINSYSKLWELPIALAERLGLAKPSLRQNWLTVEDITNLLHLSGFDVIRSWPEILLPLPVPVLNNFCNKFLVRLWPFKSAAMTNFVIGRPHHQGQHRSEEPLVSVIVPARNEAGNIPHVFARIPELGRGTELVFVEGHSKDYTYGAIEKAIAENPERQCQLLRQTGKGKGDAVRMGFAHAKGDIFMILDADMTVLPEDLPGFLEALLTGKGEFINGVRLVYPMQDKAMRFLNLVGNKFFSLTFSWLLGQPIKDTLCGTKVMWRTDYDLIAANRAYFGDFDPFGDFDLLLGAAKLNLKIIDLPIRYRERTYGTTNIQRWNHGWYLLKMVMFAAKRMKFV